MVHHSGLIATVTLGLVAAFIGGLIATRLRLPVIVGYLLAGIAVGPHTPGFVGNAKIATELAEIGVILLMFGVGIHFSLRDLLSVREIVIPGALGQIAFATALGTSLALAWEWSLAAGLVFGLALAVASTVVLLRSLTERDLLDTIHGRVAVGWLIVQDLFTVLVLVLVPVIAVFLGGEAAAGRAAAAGSGNALITLALALGKTVMFFALMIVVGARVVPWLLVQVARSGSRELFILAVLAVALGIAYGAATLFGVSLALGAFLAGAVVGESDLSHQVAADALPLRDAFAVLFFVSVGMLFDPAFLLAAPGRVIAALAIIILANGVAGLLLVLVLKYPLRTGLIVAAGLAQIGEFSFIVAGLGRSLGLLPEEGYQLVLAGALLSIVLNPLLFRAIDPLEAWLSRHPRLVPLRPLRADSLTDRSDDMEGQFRDHAVICGYGRVGSEIGQLLQRQRYPFVVVDQNRRWVEELRQRGIAAFYGDAGLTESLSQADLAHAKVLVVAIPDPLATRRIVDHARESHPHLDIVARTHSEREWAYLRERVSEAVLGEREAAIEMARYTLRRFGVSDPEIQAIVEELRGRVERERPGEPLATVE
jgi:CPA2 family monovalent cation:H+ antiporter-2